MTGSAFRIQWQSVVDKTYRVSYAAAIGADAWIPAAPQIIATETTTSMTDEAPPSERRFYRIELVR